MRVGHQVEKRKFQSASVFRTMRVRLGLYTAFAARCQEPRSSSSRLLLRLQAFGDVVDHAQPRRPPAERQIEGDDFALDLLPVLLAVARDALHVRTAPVLKIPP